MLPPPDLFVLFLKISKNTKKLFYLKNYFPEFYFATHWDATTREFHGQSPS
jgi:hypothetical protein